MGRSGLSGCECQTPFHRRDGPFREAGGRLVISTSLTVWLACRRFDRDKTAENYFFCEWLPRTVPEAVRWKRC